MPSFSITHCGDIWSKPKFIYLTARTPTPSPPPPLTHFTVEQCASPDEEVLPESSVGRGLKTHTRTGMPSPKVTPPEIQDLFVPHGSSSVFRGRARCASCTDCIERNVAPTEDFPCASKLRTLSVRLVVDAPMSSCFATQNTCRLYARTSGSLEIATAR